MFFKQPKSTCWFETFETRRRHASPKATTVLRFTTIYGRGHTANACECCARISRQLPTPRPPNLKVRTLLLRIPEKPVKSSYVVLCTLHVSYIFLNFLAPRTGVLAPRTGVWRRQRCTQLIHVRDGEHSLRRAVGCESV